MAAEPHEEGFAVNFRCARRSRNLLSDAWPGRSWGSTNLFVRTRGSENTFHYLPI